jgi:tetratricopeptide (TPR) repeat protein
MMLQWFNAREAADVGTALADEFAARAAAPAAPGKKTSNGERTNALEELLRRADREVRSLRLNFYKKAKFANSFKWRLIENGVKPEVADEVTQSLVLHLSQIQPPELTNGSSMAATVRPDLARAKDAFHRGNKYYFNGAYAEAADCYEEATELDPAHAESVNNLGTALAQLGRYKDAEQCFRQAIALKPSYPDPYCNLGSLQRSIGDLAGSEASLRQALRLKPNYVDARINLGLTLALLGRLRDAKACFAKILKTAPRNLGAMHGMGQIANLEGRFEEAEKTFTRILEIDAKRPSTWAALAGLRKMTSDDGHWFERAKEIAASRINSFEEADLRFAIGKYCDDVGDFDEAFRNYKRGNDLRKAVAEDYDLEERTRLIDDLIRVYAWQSIANIHGAGSASIKPVFVVGMPRSGTSLAEQIIASHPSALGAGELPFWETLVGTEKDVRQGILSDPIRAKVAEEYLRLLESRSADALRIVDKAPVNSDYLGVIYSVFPNARVIYMQRDPIDTCLSCYFQQFLMGLNFTMDLSDLAHYYRGHQHLMAHWRAVLPPGFILDVPYEALVADQETWTRKMLDFIGLEWDDRCLDFHKNTRQVVTASAWQVRQKIYKNSVARWRNYEKFIGPLKALRK